MRELPAPLPFEMRGGIIPFRNKFINIVAVSESWPTWWQALTPARGYKYTAVYTDSKMIDSWRDQYDDSVWKPIKDFHPTNHPQSHHYALPGSSKFVRQLLSLLSPSAHILVSLELNHLPWDRKNGETWSWLLLAHPDSGGATTGRYWCRARKERWSLQAPLTIESDRRIRHHLKPLLQGATCEPPVNPEGTYKTLVKETGLVHPGCWLRITSPRVRIKAPCVFSRTGWVARTLHSRELAACCDVPDFIAKALPNQPIAKTSFLALQFVFNPPAKILGTVLDHALKAVTVESAHQVSEDSALMELTYVSESPLNGEPPCQEDGPRRVLQFEGFLAEPNADLGQKNVAKEPASKLCRGDDLSPVPQIEDSLAEPSAALGRNKAAKNDDAGINYDFWDLNVIAPWSRDPLFEDRIRLIKLVHKKHPNDSIRKLALHVWKRNVWRSLRRHLRKSFDIEWAKRRSEFDSTPLEKTLSAGSNCIRRCMNADWWTSGFRLLFWRWPSESQDWARDGLPIPMLTQPIPYKKPQPREKDPDIRAAVRAKFDKFRGKGYVTQGTVSGLTGYFTVPKGDGDVRLVFDATKSGLNKAIWSPSFSLPSLSSLLSALEPGIWMADIDVAEHFHNFLLDPVLRPFCGVDISPYYSEVTSWERWERCVMGIKTSPYGCIRMDLLGDEVNRGNHTSPHNPFFYDQLRLNLPGSPDYQPSVPWVSKVDSSTGCLAGVVKTYVDDKRPTGHSYEHCRRVARRTASTLSYLGMQDASRKREAPSQRAGAWSGVVCHTDTGAVRVLCTQDKWDKAGTYIQELQAVNTTTNSFPHKRLEHIRGFLIYVIRTYPAFTSYLKGIHLTLDSWRPGRDQEGWKILNAIHHFKEAGPVFDEDTHAPEYVQGVPRLKGDLQALAQLFSTLHPPRRVIRSSMVLMALYGFGDASGEGFGSTLSTPSGIRIGTGYGVET
jgi:hypothetical protein